MRKQANSEGCYVCGMENPGGFQLSFYEHPDGSVRSNLTVEPRFEGWPGIVHGGVIATLLDEVTARVYMNDSSGNRLMMTGKLEIRYRRPVKTGSPITIIGYPEGQKGRVATARGEMRDAEGTILAEATSTLIQASEELSKELEMQNRNWVMYPDEVKP